MPPLRSTSAVLPFSSAFTATAHSFSACCRESKRSPSRIMLRYIGDYMTQPHTLRQEASRMTQQETAHRIERDSMGEVEVPRDALFGAQTRRALDNFPISDLRKPRRFV